MDFKVGEQYRITGEETPYMACSYVGNNQNGVTHDQP